MQHPHAPKTPSEPYVYRPYPKALSHPDGRKIEVNGPEEHEAKEAEGFTDKPLPLKPQAPAQNLDEAFCSRCEAARKQFDEAWGKLSQAHGDLLAKHSRLHNEHEALKGAFQSLSMQSAQMQEQLLAKFQSLSVEQSAPPADQATTGAEVPRPPAASEAGNGGEANAQDGQQEAGAADGSTPKKRSKK